MRKFAKEIPSQLHIWIWIFYNNPLQSRELPNVNFISICWFHYYVNFLMYLYPPLDMHMKQFKRSIHVGQTMSTSKCNCSFINKDEYYEDFFLFFLKASEFILIESQKNHLSCSFTTEGTKREDSYECFFNGTNSEKLFLLA